jgi:hypothetical protein
LENLFIGPFCGMGIAGIRGMELPFLQQLPSALHRPGRFMVPERGEVSTRRDKNLAGAGANTA